MKPAKILQFILGVFLLLTVVVALTPANGIKVGDFTFHMLTFRELLFDEKPRYADVNKILDKQFNIDSLVEIGNDSLTSDSIMRVIHKANYDSLVQSLTKIEISKKGGENLYRFFRNLERDSASRIMHYGDSQIEGDRITAFVRNKLQQKFGGTGPGLRPALQPYDYVFTAHQENYGNWKRYPIYGDVDSTLQHNRYGVMAAFSRFAPHATDSVPALDSTWYDARLTISKSAVAFKRTRKYENMRLFYGNSRAPVLMQVMVKDSVFYTDTLLANVNYAVSEYQLPDSVGNISISFAGFDSPDIYGIELASDSGIIMDNIALRGSSGLVFRKNNREHSKKMYSDLNPGLFILQFGGNVMPYITNKKAIQKYGRRFKKEIEYLQQLCPEAAIIIVGPSDMSTKVKDNFVTYPHLPDVVETLREVAFSTGSGFWNMYEAMGGKNSMPAWVNAEPELARPDYTHFSARGARLVANMFYNALILEYNNYLEEKQQKQ